MLESTLGGIVAMPLISFHSLIDEDIACLKYAIIDIGINPFFDLNKLKTKTYIEIIGDIYHRNYKNPLNYIQIDNINQDGAELLDRVYNELLSDKEEDILKHAVLTDIIDLIISFKESSDIIPTILYYTDAQKNVLDNIKDISSINKVNLKEALLNIDQYKQFYFKSLDEFEPFRDLEDRTFYFSTYGLNLTESKDDINFSREELMPIIKKRNKISLYDIYRTDVIGSY